MQQKLRIRYTSSEAQALYKEGGEGQEEQEAHVGLAYASPEAAGLDLRACFEEESLLIKASERALIPSGIAVEPVVPAGQSVAGFVYSRSGLGAKHGLTVAQGVGVIDSDYRGEILICLLNTSAQDYLLKRGERIAQLVYQPILRMSVQPVTELSQSARGTGGFGHTGKI